LKASTVVIPYKDGAVKVNVDAEDVHLFNEFFVYVKRDCFTDTKRIIFRDIDNPFVQQYASRAVLLKHKQLNVTKNVMLRNGDSFDLRKQNLYQA
jgi:hypothetical protein